MKKNSISDRWFAVVNPNSGSGKGKKDWKRIAGVLERNGIDYRMKLTEYRGHAINITKDLIGEGYRKFISVGGDGTLNEIVNGIFDQDHCLTTDCTIGQIPVGTGNDWGRMFGIPMVYEGAARVLKEERTMKHDIGYVDYYNDNKKERRYFINIAGLGFETLVVKKTNSYKDKGKSNKAIYFWNIISSLTSYKYLDANIFIEGRSIQNRVFSINVGNGRFSGGGMRQTPEALPYDGLLDVTVIREIGRIEVIRSLKLLYDGTLLSHPQIDGYRCSSFRVTTGTPAFIEADGELLGFTPAEFGIIPASVNIVYATKSILEP